MKKLLLLFSAFALTATQAQITVNLPVQKDNSIFQANPDNSSGSGKLYAGTTCNGGVTRTLVEFNLNTIPSSAVITDVQVSFNVDNVSSSLMNTTDYTLHRVLIDWGNGTSVATGGGGATATSGDATWNNAFHNTDAWGTVGGDYEATSSGAANFSTSTGTETFNSTQGLIDDVQNWINNVHPNYGWILIGEENTNCTARRMGSKEVGTEAVLTVTYFDPLSIEDNANADVQVYPNPAENTIQIESDEPINQYDIYDLKGKLILSGNYNNQIDISSLDKGIYMITLNNSIVEKLVVE